MNTHLTCYAMNWETRNEWKKQWKKVIELYVKSAGKKQTTATKKKKKKSSVLMPDNRELVELV